jgi:hypothetical protein
MTDAQWRARGRRRSEAAQLPPFEVQRTRQTHTGGEICE